MLGKRLHTFSKFILERADRNVGSYYLNKFKQIKDSEVISKLEDLSEVLNYLEDTYWYNREGEKAHYALNMKIYSWPDLEDWAKARGEEDLEDVNDEMMYEDWARFMEETYEVHAEDYMESFSWIKNVGVGGKAGGWLLIYPEASHDNIEDDASYAIEDYLNYMNTDSELEFIKQLITNPDVEELASMGILDGEELDNARDAMKSRQELLTWVDKQIAELGEVSQDLNMIKNEIEAFKNNAGKIFLEWVQGLSMQ